MPFPATKSDLFKLVVQETAKMSYPGSMSRGSRPIVAAGTKQSLSEYFESQLFIDSLCSNIGASAQKFERWHRRQVRQIAIHICDKVRTQNKKESVAAKFLNTFMYQLMKYDYFRPLWPKLHLPLDRRIFDALRRIESPSLQAIREQLKSSPYRMDYERHLAIQQVLLNFIKEINERPRMQFKIISRIELNLLWV